MADENDSNNRQTSTLDASRPQDVEGINTKATLLPVHIELSNLQNVDSKTSSILPNHSNQAHGGWKTMPYIMGNELTANMATIGLQWNLIIYLTQVFHMGQVKATNVLNISSGTSGVAALFGAVVADAWAGRFLTILSSSIIILLGMSLLLVTATVRSFRPIPCPKKMTSPYFCQLANKNQEAFLLAALFLLAIGSGGLSPCTYAFGADQFQQRTAQEKKNLQSFSNWYFFVLNVTLLLCSTLIVYVQTNVGWGWGFAIPVIIMALSILIFVAGFTQYRHHSPTGSVFTSLLQVLVAAFRKRKLRLPSDESELFRGNANETSDLDSHNRLVHTNKFRILDKAAIKTQGDVSEQDGIAIQTWTLCTVHQVEELKCLLRILPIWASGIVMAANLSLQRSYPVLQAVTMDRHIFGSSFQIPPGSIGAFGIIALIIWVPFYDQVVVPIARRITGNVRGITLLQRIGTGCFLVCIGMLISGVVESMRRRVAQRNGVADQLGTPIPMSVFWLIPQCFLMGVAEAFHLIGQVEFFYDQMPMGMRSAAGAIFSLSSAVGNYLGSGLISLIHKVTQRRGDWLADNLNSGHLDYLYYLLSALLTVNLVFFIASARWYTYKKVEPEDVAHSEEARTMVDDSKEN